MDSNEWREPAAGMTRRRFVQTSAALAAAPLLTGLLPQSAPVFAAGSDALRVGLVGCGGRGTGAAQQALTADPGVVITALSDVFSDRIDACHKALSEFSKDGRVQVPAERRFTGFDGYQRLIGSDVDVVLLCTAPGFRPLHLKAAVAAGKHVFCEKPVAVDGPGVRSVLESVAAARAKKLTLVSGFCWRYSLAERATMERIHAGDIGAIRAVYTTYLTGTIGTKPRRPEWSDVEWQLRNWHHFSYFSGDHMVEQAVHSIDKMAWALKDETPVRAVAVGGRAARSGAESGNSFDHFSVTYEYASGARGFHMCRQIANCPSDNSDLVLGETGVCEFNGWAPRHTITGQKPWRYKGDSNDMYQQEHDELFASIRAGRGHNDGVWMAHSTLTAIMARMAAYTGATVTWDAALNSTEELLPMELATRASLTMPAIAVPGVTKFS
ncbi:MAG: Gfo/Idh/MocA family protein [Planctomycetota bacterium]